MASVVDICNLALAHLGDSATVASIDPPEGSVQAEHCARFYPMALGGLLSAHPWGFATRRYALPLLSGVDVGSWTYAYAVPADMVKLIDICWPGDNTPQPYAIANSGGRVIVATDAVYAVARYIAKITDPTLFPYLFTLSLSYALAALLAGPILKGKAGAEQSMLMTKMAMDYMAQAKVSDANDGPITIESLPPWIEARGAATLGPAPPVVVVVSETNLLERVASLEANRLPEPGAAGDILISDGSDWVASDELPT